MRKRLCRWIGWTVIAGANLPLWASDGPASQSPILEIEVYNLARVGSKDLARAEREAAIIFAQAGIDVNWSDGSLRNPAELVRDFSANSTSGPCIAASQIGQVKVQLRTSTPKSIWPGAFGYALPCAKFGIKATVFVDRCEEVMNHISASLPKVLAHVMAHEIGHVLLRSEEHSDSGIMHGRWTKADWQTVAVSHMTFLPRQAEQMRDGLAIRNQTSTVAAMTRESFP